MSENQITAQMMIEMNCFSEVIEGIFLFFSSATFSENIKCFPFNQHLQQLRKSKAILMVVCSARNKVREIRN